MFHWQNLNDRRDGFTGPGWRHGRAWWHLGERLVLRVEWNLLDPRTWPSVRFEWMRTFGDDEDLAGHVSVPLLGSLYWGVSGLFPRRWWNDAGPGRQTGVELFREYLWIKLWYADPAEHWGEDRNRFRWQCISWDWMRTFFGRRDYEMKVISDWEPVEVALPEATYSGQFRVVQRTWWRSRWPKKLIKCEGEIRMDKGAPFPGKGENSWDCGDDAIMGMSGPPTKAETIGAYVVATLRNRERYGGSVAWRPREKSGG